MEIKVGRKVFEYWSFVSVPYSPAIDDKLYYSQSITFLQPPFSPLRVSSVFSHHSEAIQDLVAQLRCS